MTDDYKTYQKQVKVNAQAMADIFIERGFDVVSGGTDDHLFLVSFIEQGLTGKAVDLIALLINWVFGTECGNFGFNIINHRLIVKFITNITYH
jgi:glycine/serine hydroxymethyltransferase